MDSAVLLPSLPCHTLSALPHFFYFTKRRLLLQHFVYCHTLSTYCHTLSTFTTLCLLPPFVYLPKCVCFATICLWQLLIFSQNILIFCFSPSLVWSYFTFASSSISDLFLFCYQLSSFKLVLLYRWPSLYYAVLLSAILLIICYCKFVFFPENTFNILILVLLVNFYLMRENCIVELSYVVVRLLKTG